LFCRCQRRATICRNGTLHHSAPKKHYKQNEKAVREWLDVTYPDIERQAAEENAVIYWIDEVGIQNTSNYVKGYAPRGQTPTIPVARPHTRVNMISAITNSGKLRFHFYSGKMNQDLFKAFLIRLIKTTDKKVYAIADNLTAHHGLRLADWRAENTDKIKLFYLPSYAPELNPVEYLNNNLKFETAKKGYSKDENQIRSKAMSSIRSLQSKKSPIPAFFHHQHVAYAKLNV
jgi:transposase